MLRAEEGEIGIVKSMILSYSNYYNRIKFQIEIKQMF